MGTSVPDDAQTICTACGEKGHPADDCRPLQCWGCGGPHIEPDCPNRAKATGTECWRCGKEGHKRRHCDGYGGDKCRRDPGAQAHREVRMRLDGEIKTLEYTLAYYTERRAALIHMREQIAEQPPLTIVGWDIPSPINAGAWREWTPERLQAARERWPTPTSSKRK